jgi:PKD repeat protein
VWPTASIPPDFTYAISSCLTVSFNATPCASSYRWDFGDSTTSTSQDPVHMYSAKGTYTVRLTVNGSTTISKKLTLGTTAQIAGPDEVCLGFDNLPYYNYSAVNSQPGSIPTWAVTGGTISGVNNADAVDVVWSALPGTVTLTIADPVTSCSDTATMTVQPHCNRPPVAKCGNVSVPSGPHAHCLASASIDIGSYDSDPGDTITVAQSPPGPYPLGPTIVTLTVIDSHGASRICQATVNNTGDNKGCKVTSCFMGNPATGQSYPYTDPAHPRTSTVFDESATLRKLEPSVAMPGDTLRLWYGDKHALVLGVRAISVKTKGGMATNSFPTTPFVATVPATRPVAGSASPVRTGATEPQGGIDPAGRPISPSLFCTDITPPNDLSNAGDWQMGGKGTGPDFVSGSWRAATILIDQTRAPVTRTITTDKDPAKNHYTMGPEADPVPSRLHDQGYGAEARWNVNGLTCYGAPLQSGHTYRMQFMIHDGAQNKAGGGVGQGCANVAIP